MAFLGISLVCFLFRTLCNKEFSRNFSGLMSNIFFNAIGLSVTFVISALCGGASVPSGRLLLMTSIFAVLFVSTVIIILFAYAKGPLGPVQMIYAMSTLVSTIAGLIVFKESINWMKIAGLILVSSVFVLNAMDKQAKGQEGKKAYVSPKVWMPIALAAMLTNGLLGAVENMGVQWCSEGIMAFNFWGYLIGSAILWIGLLICRLCGLKMPQVKEMPRKFAVVSLLCGLLASGGNILLMYALSTLESSIAFPLQSVTNLTLLYFISLFYYKEARSRFGIPMLICAGCGIVLLAMA